MLFSNADLVLGWAALKKVYRALRGAREDNVWSPGQGRWFVTVIHFRGAWGLRHWWRGGGYGAITDGAEYGIITDGAEWGWRVWLSGWKTWFVPVLQTAHTHETKPPYRAGRGVAVWLWGRCSIVIGRWAPSGYDPYPELKELWDRGTAEAVEEDFTVEDLKKYRIH